MTTQHVTVYSTPACPYCKMAKEFFREHKVKFTDVNVAKDGDKAEEMIKKSGQMGVPVIVISGLKGQEDIVIGFNRERLAELLGIHAE